jgi:predicted dehydrogenase
MFEHTYGHTPIKKAFEQLDVYGIAPDEERTARRKIRLGIIGAGGVAQSKYFPAVARLRMIWEPIEITAFAEPRAEHGRKIQSIYGGAWYADYRAMLVNEPLDGVLVLGPDDLHMEHTLAALESGRPVLVEKPIARSLADADAMCEASEARRTVLMTVANKRCSPPYLRAKQFIVDGPVHDPAMFIGKFNLGYDYVDLFESGTIHLFDLTRFFMGDIRTVSAAGVNKYSRNRRCYPVDNAAVTLEFASGAVGALYTSSSALSLKPWERVEIYGDHAWLAVEDQYELILYDGEEDGARSWRAVVPNTLLFDEEFGGYMGIVESFAQAIRGAMQPCVTGRDGYAAFELLRAIQLSLLHRTPVRLPLEPVTADADAMRWLKASGWPG